MPFESRKLTNIVLANSRTRCFTMQNVCLRKQLVVFVTPQPTWNKQHVNLRTHVDVFVQVFYCIIYSVIVYPMVGFGGEAGQILRFYFLLLTVMEASYAVGMLNICFVGSSTMKTVLIKDLSSGFCAAEMSCVCTYVRELSKLMSIRKLDFEVGQYKVLEA